MTISWQNFWQWVQDDPEIARVVKLYETRHPPEANVTPEGGWTEPFGFRKRMPTTQERLHELMRFLYMRATSGTRRPLHSASGLDAFWHALIVETEAYRAVCDKLGGFIDHRSGQFTDDPLWYAWFLRAYMDTFGGEKPDWNVWPSPSPRETLADQASRAMDHDCA